MCYLLFYLIGTWWSIYTNFIFNKTKKFSIHLLFHPPNQTQMSETKIFSIFPLFYHFFIFYPFTFPSSQPNESRVCACRTVCLTDPSNDQLVKDEGAQIFYSIRSQTKSIGIGAKCEIPHNPSLIMRLSTTRTYDQALIPLVGPCALPIHPMTNWWRMRGTNLL